MKTWQLGFVPGIALLCICASAGAQDPAASELKSRFYAEAPKAWQEYLASIPANFVLISHAHREGGVITAIPAKSRTTWKRMNDSYLQIEEYQDVSGQEYGEAWGQNPDYSFRLSRKKGSTAWTLTRLASQQDDELQDRFRRMCCTRLTLWNLPLPQLIQDREFRLCTIGWQKHGEKQLVHFEFEYLKPPEQYPFRGGHKIQGGWALLDPADFWLLTAYRVYTIEKGQRVWFAQTFQSSSQSARGKLDHSGTIELPTVDVIMKVRQEFFQDSAQSEDFRLSAFGIAEPAGLSKPTPWWLYISLSGLAIVLLGLVYYAWRRRRSAALV